VLAAGAVVLGAAALVAAALVLDDLVTRVVEASAVITAWLDMKTEKTGEKKKRMSRFNVSHVEDE